MKKNVYIYIYIYEYVHEWFCCAPEIYNIVNQPYCKKNFFNKKIKSTVASSEDLP